MPSITLDDTTLSFTLPAGDSSATGVTGNALDNTLIGNEFDNLLSGAGGKDNLVGGPGADTLAGGADDDNYSVDQVGDRVIEQPGQGIDSVLSQVSFSLGANLENLFLVAGSSLALMGVGNGFDNFIAGNEFANRLLGDAGFDTLDGGAGIDTLEGGANGDHYYLDDANDKVIELVNEGQDTVHFVGTAGSTYQLTAHTEALVLEGDQAINGTGNNLNNWVAGNGAANVLRGGEGLDYLDGGQGADTLIGGTENDVYIVDDLGDVVVEDTPGEWGGFDIVTALASHTLSANVEMLTLQAGASAALSATGNGLDNVLQGNEFANTLSGLGGNDTLIGGGGADTLVGGSGDDEYLVVSARDVVTELDAGGNDTVYLLASAAEAYLPGETTYRLAAHIETLKLAGAGPVNVQGNDQNNWIDGSDEANAIDGAGGDDYLDGKGGADTLRGGLGNDTFVVESAGDQVLEGQDQGIDFVQARISFALGEHVEHLVLIDGAAEALNATGNGLGNYLQGNGLANVLDGAAGDDFLLGGLGQDTLIGGAGNDTFFVDNPGDVVVEGADGGADTVQFVGFVGNSYALAAEAEVLEAYDGTVISGTTLSLSGNASNNTVHGSVVAGVNNLINGQGGDDALFGKDGADTLLGGAGNDILDGSGGNDRLVDDDASSGDLYVWGRDGGADAINDAGGSDLVLVNPGVSANQLWFSQVGSDLEVSVIGTSDRLRVEGWFSNPAQQIELFKLNGYAPGGQILLAGSVQGLVNAMASFTPPAQGQTTLTPALSQALGGVIANSWVSL